MLVLTNLIKLTNAVPDIVTFIPEVAKNVHVFVFLALTLINMGTALAQWLSAVLQIGRLLVRSQLVSLHFH